MEQATANQERLADPREADVTLGSVVSLWRYPVKSMLGEELPLSEITPRGVLGDRAYALRDNTDGKIASAKNPRKWPRMFEFQAAFTAPVRLGGDLPPVRIRLPDGTELTNQDANHDEILSQLVGRAVTLETVGQKTVGQTPSVPAQSTPTAEEYWPDIEGLDHRDAVTDFDLPQGTFFDCAVVHVLTTGTLDRLRALYPKGRFEVRRFRPNIVVETPDEREGFVENDWVGRTIQIGDKVLLNVTEPCPRCVMTTLAQGDLPKDSGILRTAAQHNRVNVGVYAAVLRTGTVRRGDGLRLGAA
jgi:uncharacterized protein YcbX